MACEIPAVYGTAVYGTSCYGILGVGEGPAPSINTATLQVVPKSNISAEIINVIKKPTILDNKF